MFGRGQKQAGLRGRSQDRTPEGISAIGDATKGRFFSLFFEANTRTNRHRLRKHWCKDIFALSGSFVKQRFSFSLRGLFYYDRWLSW